MDLKTVISDFCGQSLIFADRLRRAGLLPPEGTAFWWNPLEGPSGPGYYFTPPFLLNTPLFCVFLLIPFRNVTKLLRITQRHPFSFRNVAKLYGLRNNALFDFQNVAKLFGLRNNALFPSGMSRNFTNYLTIGVKYLEAVKRRLHATNQWSLNEIRV